MSRHRYVRNLDLDDELDDEAFDEEAGGDDEYEQFDALVPQVFAVLGLQPGVPQTMTHEGTSLTLDPLTEKEVKDTLWYYYFDMEKSVDYLLEDRQKKVDAAKKKDHPIPTSTEPMPSSISLEDSESRPIHTNGEEVAQGETSKPLTALQRLALARQKRQSGQSDPNAASARPLSTSTATQPKKPSSLAALAGRPHSSSQSPASATSLNAITANPAPESKKPISKLAALAAARRTATAVPAIPAETPVSPGPVPTSSNSNLDGGAGGATKMTKLQMKMKGLNMEGKADKGRKDKAGGGVNGLEGSEDNTDGRADGGLPFSELFPTPPNPGTNVGMEIDSLWTRQLKSGPSTFAGLLGPSSPQLFPSPMMSTQLHFGKTSTEAAMRIHMAISAGNLDSGSGAGNAFQGPSPDDRILMARKGTSLGRAAQQKKKAQALSSISTSTASKTKSPASTSTPSTPKTSTPSTPKKADLSAAASKLSITEDGGGGGGTAEESEPPAPVVSIAKEILEEVRRKELEGAQKPVLSLIVIGHVDAGKSTLMGRLMLEIGELSEKAFNSNQRQSQKIGKSSFAYAWTFDQLSEERERGVTIDVTVDSFSTPHRSFTLIDAPGHRDFIPNMISGASQADTALLVVDASKGAFEAGIGKEGQTREHVVLVRSLGVQQVVIAVNKLDVVGWAQKRFDHIVEDLKPILSQAGFSASKLAFIPCAAAAGENLLERRSEELKSWYDGPTLFETLDTLDIPSRNLEAPLRIPISNVFKGQTATASGLGASGRIESGIVQVGESLSVLPGDETGVVRVLEVNGETVPWALAGSNVTLYLAGIEPNYVSVGSVLCPPSQPVPLVATFSAQIVVFDITFPLTAGSLVELYHHSRDIPATVSKLEATLDRASGKVLKENPRILSKNSSARVQVTIRPSGSKKPLIPLETFSTNKSFGRFLLRRGQETVAAGVILELL